MNMSCFLSDSYTHDRNISNYTIENSVQTLMVLGTSFLLTSNNIQYVHTQFFIRNHFIHP